MLKFALLSLLAKEPRHGYDLRSALERLFGGTWPLNEGQIYLTLRRLERDGLITSEVVPQDLLQDRKVYTLTPEGWEAVTGWLAAPVTDRIPVKDEFFVKVLMHSIVAGGDPYALIAAQRAHLLQSLAHLNRRRNDEEVAPPTRLLLEGAVLHVEADLRWLEICENHIDDLKAKP